MPLGLGFEIKRKKIYVMYKNLKTPAFECLENGNLNCTENLLPAKQHFFRIDQLIAENPKFVGL